jgi:hypothetical protein
MMRESRMIIEEAFKDQHITNMIRDEKYAKSIMRVMFFLQR